MAVSDRPRFEFVSYPGVSEKERKLASIRVKKHVMYDYLRRRPRPDRNSPVSILEGERTTPIGHVSPLSPSHCKPCTSRVINSHDSCFNSLEPAKVNLTPTVDQYNTSGPTECLINFKDLRSFASWTPEQACTSINAHPGPYRLEPFDTLPITNVPDDLIHWHFALHSCQRMSPWMHTANAGWFNGNGLVQHKILFFCVSYSLKQNGIT